MKLLIIHGPNLNMLGQREPDIYGTDTLDSINHKLQLFAKEKGVDITTFQSNHEGELVEQIQLAPSEFEGLVINPAAYTHTSIALQDALKSITIPKIEVHLSNIYQRESFRQVSYTAGACLGVISGFGVTSYLLAIEALYLQSLSESNI